MEKKEKKDTQRFKLEVSKQAKLKDERERERDKDRREISNERVNHLRIGREREREKKAL